MVESVRLSEASRAAVEALSSFDYVALERLTSRVQAAANGEVALTAEPADLVESNQKILAGVLMATEQNLTILLRLRERKAEKEWAL